MPTIIEHELAKNPIVETVPDMVCANLAASTTPVPLPLFAQKIASVIAGFQSYTNNIFLMPHPGPATPALRIAAATAVGKMVPAWIEFNNLPNQPTTAPMVDTAIGAVINAFTVANCLPVAQSAQEPPTPELTKQILDSTAAIYIAYCKFSRTPPATLDADSAGVQAAAMSHFARHPFV